MSDPKSCIRSSVDESQKVKEAFFSASSEALIAVAQRMGETILNGGKILICGNGGSASDAQHFAGEMVGRLMQERRALPAIALTTDCSILTAVGNDYGFDQVFSRQVDGLGKADDIFFAISTSGNSPNVLNAVETAKSKKMWVVGLTGNNGGKLGPMVDIHLNVSEGKNSPRIQETHIAAIHVLVDLLDRFYLGASTEN